MAGSIDGLLTFDLLLSDLGNLTILDTHITHFVIAGLRIDHSPVKDHDIKVFCIMSRVLIRIAAAMDDDYKQKQE
jgi:hypothetical protein